MIIQQLREALVGQRYESTRRLALAALVEGHEASNTVRLLLHEALRALGDIAAARAVLEAMEPQGQDEQLDVALRLAEDYHRLAGADFYRTSSESKAGLCIDEYTAKYDRLADAAFARALPLADTPERKAGAAMVLRRCRRGAEADALAPAPAAVRAELPAPAGFGSLAGRLSYADGTPVAGATVTIGFPQAVTAANPRGHLQGGIGGGMAPTFHGQQQARTITTDDQGGYSFSALPAQSYPFLAVALDPEAHAIALRFFARDIRIDAGEDATVDAVLEEWQSAPARELAHPFLPNRVVNGMALERVALHPLRNPFHVEFPRQFVQLPAPVGAAHSRLLLFTSDAPEEAKPLQLLADGSLGCFLDLPDCTERMAAIYQSSHPLIASPLTLQPEADGTLILDTGCARFRLPSADADADAAPILAVQGHDGVWRGNGRLILPPDITVATRRCELVEGGHLLLRLAISYALSNGQSLRFELTAHRDEPYLLVRETSAPIPGAAFEFSLREFGGGKGRGFLHWTPEHGNLHWTSLTAANREVARLQESVAWWIPPQGFGYAMTADGLQQHDYIGVFTRRRGEWIDRDFEAIAQGPGDDCRELDWPFPEMVGSTISMITAHTRDDGDACFRFGCFDGERQWGLLVSTLDRNDGPHKEISAVQHKVSSPRLQEFLTWRLHDEDHLERPSVLAGRDELLGLRRKKASPAFAPIWEKLVHDHQRGPSRALRALLESDPCLAWRLASEMRIEAPLRSRMTLLGRDYADVFSPVGGRGITPFAEQYDLIAPTGVFSAEEEREVRAMLLLMGHMYMEEDFMNWRFNSRNANFEADRVDIVGAIGLAFRGNPDADAMIQHAAELMERSLNVYCTPGSGKWYENPACYYIHAASCRLNLAFHLYRHGILDSTAIPRLRDFLSWGPLLLTAPYPHDYALLRDGCDFESYEQAAKVRRIPPIGDHAKLGQWVSEFFALMGRAYRQRDPAFAEFLTWAYQAGGSDGGHFSKLPLFFTAMCEQDLQAARPQHLTSRRLEGFGALFRGNFGQTDEFYLLFKQGPGGYRYHRTEGSFLLMAHGRPLIFDGGEAGETWRHSTLSFHETHMPLAPGHVERFHSFDSVDFVQGVHPKALSPGEPVFLSDSCEHTLVEVAWQRFHEPDPADLRSLLWVKDEYVIVSDDLHLPAGTLTHWHLQVVSDAHSGNPRDGYRFAGRYGVDLQLLLPDLPADAVEKVEQVPTLEYHVPPESCFSMRHVQLTMTAPRQLHALLRPLAPGRQPLRVTAFKGGLQVSGEGIDDTLFFSRDEQRYQQDDITFTGRYAAILRRPAGTTLILLDGCELRVGEHCLTAIGETSLLV